MSSKVGNLLSPVAFTWPTHQLPLPEKGQAQNKEQLIQTCAMTTTLQDHPEEKENDCCVIINTCSENDFYSDDSSESEDSESVAMEDSSFTTLAAETVHSDSDSDSDSCVSVIDADSSSGDDCDDLLLMGLLTEEDFPADFFNQGQSQGQGQVLSQGFEDDVKGQQGNSTVSISMDDAWLEYFRAEHIKAKQTSPLAEHISFDDFLIVSLDTISSCTSTNVTEAATSPSTSSFDFSIQNWQLRMRNKIEGTAGAGRVAGGVYAATTTQPKEEPDPIEQDHNHDLMVSNQQWPADLLLNDDDDDDDDDEFSLQIFGGDEYTSSAHTTAASSCGSSTVPASPRRSVFTY